MTATAVDLRPEERHYAPDGTVLNSRLPLLIYRNAVTAGPDGDVESAMLASR